MTDEEIRQRKEYLGFTPVEEAELVKLQPLIAKHADELVAAFYRHLLQFEQTRRLLSNELITSRLLAAQRKYLLELVGGNYGQEYFRDRLNIGYVHERIGLTPEWYLGAYNLYMTTILPMIHTEYKGRPAEVLTLYTALKKIVYLDMGLVLEAYIQKSNEKLEFANRQLAAMAKELGQGLDKRTQELMLTQEHLQQAERLAELGTLASGMAHEIGTPMNVILGRAEFLQRKTKDPDTAKGMQTIIDQVERITKIMNQLLTFARRKPIERRPTNLNKIVEDTVEVMQERLRRHRITLKLELSPSLPPADADPDQMGQVVLNLAVNAQHAIGDDGALLIRTALVPVGQGTGDEYREVIELSFIDTGHGIAPEDLDKIFNPFFTTKEVGKGTGLGLTVVHGIVQDHGGQILVESEVKKGSTFRIRLPIASR